MKSILVLEDPEDWPFDVPGVEIVLAEDYLAGGAWAALRSAKVFNLCRSYKYQSIGYYVSLLAAARGHKPLPSVSTMVDMRLQAVVRLASDSIGDLIRRSLSSIQSDTFTLSIYFGKNLARKYDTLSTRLFRLFPAPLLRCVLAREATGNGWRLRTIQPIGINDVPENHRDAVLEYAREFFEKRPVPRVEQPSKSRMSLAILHDTAEEESPSCSKTLQKFCRIAARMGVETELIEPDEIGRLAEFDALFIRETTSVNHYTFRFARRAAAEGLVVIDDPDSILRCSNKVFLAELLSRAKIRTPATWFFTRHTMDAIESEVTYPCILKQPDSAFSRGVRRVANREEFVALARELLDGSEIVIAQEFTPTEFDWRIGVLDGRPLYACRYWMARGHWQIVQRDDRGRSRWGKTETLPLWQVPAAIVNTAVAASSLIGDGLYGVDLKEIDGKPYVIEVNDNPDIHTGDEDAVAKDDLYEQIIGVFLRRVEERKGHGHP